MVLIPLGLFFGTWQYLDSAWSDDDFKSKTEKLDTILTYSGFAGVAGVNVVIVAVVCIKLCEDFKLISQGKGTDIYPEELNQGPSKGKETVESLPKKKKDNASQQQETKQKKKKHFYQQGKKLKKF